MLRKIGIYVLFFVLPIGVSAHATPITYQPEAGSSVERFPESIIIEFTERIEPRASSITVFGADGDLLTGESVVDPSNARIFRSVLSMHDNGIYTVSWQVVSADDGHFTKGAYSFSVGSTSGALPSKETNIQVAFSSTKTESITIWIELFGQALLSGALLLLVCFGSANRLRVRRIIISGALLIVVGSFSHILYKTDILRDVQGGTFVSALINFIRTRSGFFTLVRGFIGIGILGTSLWKMQRSLYWVWAIGLFIIEYLRARISHAAASPFHPEFSITINFLHLAAKNAWVGLLAGFLYSMPQIDRTRKMYVRLSQILSVIFGLAGMTGVYIVWLHLKDPANIMTTDWGSGFIGLSIVGGVLGALRFYHQLIVEPRNSEGNLGKSIVLESFVGIVLLFYTASMIITTPPVSKSLTFERRTESQGVTITLQEHRAERDLMLIESNEPVRNAIVTVTNSVLNIGPIVVPLEKRFEGGYVFAKNAFSPAGDWTINITLQRPAGYDAVGMFGIQYPGDLTTSLSEEHTTRSLTLLLIFIAVGILLFAGGLFLYSSRVLGGIQDTSNQSSLPIGQTTFFLSVVVVVMLFFSVQGIQRAALKSGFERVCEARGGMWHIMTPMRNGKSIVGTSLPGCMTSDGRNHFADQREWEYFLK
ncbi:MAG: copper resistance CopC family protein [Patescibacteria group bacterium]